MTNQKIKQDSGKLNSKDLISIGVFGAILLVVYFIVGMAAGLTVIGTVFNVPITSFFTAVIYLLLAVKVRKRGVFLILGTINALPGLMAANVIGVIASIAAAFIADLVANSHHYGRKIDLILAFVTWATLHFIGYCAPMYLSSVDYLTSRQEILHLTDEALQSYLSYFTWPFFIAVALLTVVTSFLGAWLGTLILKKHFKKAGLIR